MTSSSGRPGIAILLPAAERERVSTELRLAGFEPLPVDSPDQMRDLLAGRRDVVVAIIDIETDLDAGLDAWSHLEAPSGRIPALLVVAASALDRLASSAAATLDDEYLTRPYSPESIRWRVEAMCIRAVAVDDGSGPVLQGALDASDWNRRGQLVVVFNPKGGVGKTTIATNLAAALAGRHDRRVLLVDADTVTGHVTSSLGMEGVPTVVDAWRDEADGGPVSSFSELAASHPSGIRVLALASSPIHTEILDPERVAKAITAARRGVDYVVVDLHPSYSPLNRAIFDRADRILVPVTPDLPAIRAAIQLRDVALELGVRERLALIVNRANSGLSVGDLERTIGLPAFALIRSGGVVLVRAANEGRTVVEMAPREKIAQDFADLADLVAGVPAPGVKPSFRMFGKSIAVRA